VILDACCGAMKMYNGWHKKLGDDLVTIDIRKGDYSYFSQIFGTNKKVKCEIIIRPTVLADMRFMPFRDNVFDMVIVDPPHLDVGLGSYLERRYGYWTKKELIRTMKKANEEFKRVLRDHGFILLKIRRKHFPLYEALLSNFVFFLPIERRSGAYHRKVDQTQKILWAVGQLKGK